MGTETPAAPPMGAPLRVAAAVVLAAAAVLFLTRLGDRAVVSEELRWAEVAREMRQTGAYFHPTINGRPYPDKPVGSYWLIVAASHLTGRVDEATARLPAAVAGWAGVLLVMLLGRRLYGPREGVLAGAVLATGFGFAFYARRATADVETVTGVLAAVWLAERNQGRGGPWVVALWVLMAATSLTKGLLGFALPGVVLAAHGARVGLAEVGRGGTFRTQVAAVVAGNRWLLNRWTLLAAPLGVGLFLLPFVLSAWQTGATDGLAMVWRENVRRFVAPHNHTGPPYLYLGVVFVLAAPWAAFLPAALWPPAAGRAAPGDRLARAYFWAVFVFFTLSASRRSYYLLPVLPPLALLVARVLSTPTADLPRVARRLRAGGWVVFAVGLVAAGVGLVPPADLLPGPYDQLPPLPARGAFAAGWVLCLAAFGLAVWRRRSRLPAVAAGVAFAGLGYGFLVASPAADEFRTRRAFVAGVRERAGTGLDGLALYHARDVAFDLAAPGPVPEYDAAADLAAELRAGRVGWVVARRRYLAGVALPAAIASEEASYPWEGADQIGDKLVLLRGDPAGR